MADSKISALTAATTLATTDELVIASSGSSKKITAANMLAGMAIVRGPFAFAFNTASINSGVTIYTPTVGDILLEAWIELTTSFNGTTPKGDIGTFVGTSSGLWKNSLFAGLPFDLTSTAAAEAAGTGVLVGQSAAFTLDPLSVAAQGDRRNYIPARFTATNPLKIVVSQDGLAGGAAVGGSAGAGNIYIVTATPRALP